MDSHPRRHRAGETLEDHCRACKTDRLHTVVATDAEGRVLRVECGYCHSEHGYRGGPRVDTTPDVRDPAALHRAGPGGPSLSRPHAAGDPLPLVSERERTRPRMSADTSVHDLELLLRRVIREEAGVSAVVPADKWRGGMLVLRPGAPGLQEKTWPIETFFHKVVMLRNRLRTLEQHVNASELPDTAKVRLQSYVSGCYGSLTSFNVLFADEDDQFKGSGGD